MDHGDAHILDMDQMIVCLQLIADGAEIMYIIKYTSSHIINIILYKLILYYVRNFIEIKAFFDNISYFN